MPVLASKKRVRITLASVLLFHALLISLQNNQRIDNTVARVRILDALAPIEKLVDMALGGVGNVWDRYFALVGLHDENVRLRARIDQLQMDEASHHEEVLEAERLRRSLGLQDAGIGKTVVARVIGRAPSPLRQTLTIDKGLSQGVRADSAVITPDGVVGRVIYAAASYSIVQLIIDEQSAVAVMVRSSRQQGIIKGNGGQNLELDYIDDDSELKKDDEFITSGMDRVYPKGLAAGVIVSVGPRRGLFKTVSIRPSVNLGRLEEVVCLTELSAVTADPAEEPPSTGPN